MSDGAGFAIDMLSRQLGRQFRMQQDGIARDNVQLQIHNQELVNRYNNLLRDYRRLETQAREGIAALEQQLKAKSRELDAKEYAREVAQAEADSLRASLEMIRNRQR